MHNNQIAINLTNKKMKDIVLPIGNCNKCAGYEIHINK